MKRLTVFDGTFWVHKDFPPVGGNWWETTGPQRKVEMSRKITLWLPGRPKAMQTKSVILRPGGGYVVPVPEEVRTWRAGVRAIAQDKISAEHPGFVPFQKVPLALRLSFRFRIRKDAPKRMLVRLQQGETLYRPLKPDLADNLCKALCDALTGVVWQDDELICRVESEKVYTSEAEGVVLECWPLVPGLEDTVPEAPPGRQLTLF